MPVVPFLPLTVVQCEGFRFLEYVALAMVMERKREKMFGTPHITAERVL